MKALKNNLRVARVKLLSKVIFILLLLCIVATFACSNGKKDDDVEIQSIFELNNEKYTIGVGTGSHAQMMAEKELSKAKILYFTSEL